MEEDDTVSAIIADLSENQTQLSHPTLQHLQTLTDTKDPDLLHHFFTQLTTSPLSISSLLSPLTSTMDSGPTFLSLLSTNVYLSLLLSPSSPVFSLFTPLSFLSLLSSLRRSLKQSPQQAGTHQARKRKGRALARNVAEEGESFDARSFFRCLERLVLVLDLVHLNRFPDCLKSLVHTVAEIAVLAVEMSGNFVAFGKLSDLCSRVLVELLKSEHGDEGETAAEMMKSLAPLVLGGKSQARTFALGFVKSLMVRDSEGVKKALVNLPRYLAMKAPEKAEPRGLAVEAIIEIVKAMELEEQIGYAEYVVKMSQGKANLRLLAVDLILSLMTALKDPFGMDLDDEVNNFWGRNCLEALIQRCSDSIAGIRGRALSNLAQLVGFLSSNHENCAVLKEVMGFEETGRERVEGSMNDILRKRCMDEKANVRRAAIVLVTKLTSLLGGNFDGFVLKTLGMACLDPLVSIRKAAISALSEAFRSFSDENVTIEWLHSIPRLITDNETSIQEECENLFLELVLDRISRVGSASSLCSESNIKQKDIEREIEQLFPDGVLVLLEECCSGQVTPWVKKICASLGKKKRLKPRLANALQNIIRISESQWLSHSRPIEKWAAPPGAWLLLSEVSAYLSKAVDWEFLHHHWQLLDKQEVAGELKSPSVEQCMNEEEGVESNSVAWAGDRVFLLQTISNVSIELPPEPAADLAHNLLKRIEEFNMHFTEVNAHVKALRTLCKRKALHACEADALVMKWVVQVLSKASKVVEKYISGESEVKNRNNFLTPPTRGSGKGKRTAAKSRLLSEAVIAAYTIGSLVIVCPSVDSSTIVPVLHTIITSGNQDPNLTRLPGPTVSLKQTAPSLYIQAWLTMGKICLVDTKLAKNYIPVFVQELEKSDSAALRNNLIVMMSDFCVRYTALVDCYISKITMCLRDPCELVRRQTFILLSRLLQRDYVKWRGVLFFRFLLTLVDESEKIRQLSDFLFGNILKVKAPLLAYNSFVEAIFMLNDCSVHSGHSGSKISQKERQLFSIRGGDENSRSKRRHIYISLLKQMAPAHLLATFSKLCTEILVAASDGMLSLDDPAGQSVLQDAFQILACKEIRIQSGRGLQTEGGDMDEDGVDAAATAKGRAITQAVRKALIQDTIPIFIELKRLLESKNNPLTGSLMECLRILLKDYKNEIDDILVADKQLQKELVYDMQKYEAAKAKSTAAEAVAKMQNPASFRSPSAAQAAGRTHARHRYSKNMQTDSRVASAMADAAAAATARSVLREVNKGALTPPLSSISRPKLKSGQGGSSARNNQPMEVLESLRRRQSFDSDEET